MNLPAGLIDNTIEIFASPQMHANCLSSGRVIPFSEFDPALISASEQDMLSQPVKHAGIIKMGITDRLQQIEVFLVCNYGGLDHRPDLLDGKLMKKEFWPCPRRGSCKQEGIVCDRLKTDTGAELTPRQVTIVRLIAQGLLDKEIADKLGIAMGTYTKHSKNIRLRTGLSRKADITGFAINNNLI